MSALLVIFAAAAVLLLVVVWRSGFFHRMRARDALDVGVLDDESLRRWFSYLIVRYRTRNRMIAVGFAVLVFSNAAALKWATDTSHDASRTARVAQTAASDARAAGDRTRRLARQNAANALVARTLARKLNGAVCTFVDDLRGRVRDSDREIAQTAAFLRDHPNGIPGISARLLKEGLAARRRTRQNQLATIRSFRALRCGRS